MGNQVCHLNIENNATEIECSWAITCTEQILNSFVKISVIFDAASFYGHHEYDLGIAGMFGGFGDSFYAAYHSLIPKSPGFEKRHQLYKLFHNLNHWNHFGGGYRSGSISIMRNLVK